MLNEGGLPGPLKSTAQNLPPPETGTAPDRLALFKALQTLAPEKPVLSSPAAQAAVTQNPLQQSAMQSINPSPILQQMMLMFHFGGTVKKSGNPFIERLDHPAAANASFKKQSLRAAPDIITPDVESAAAGWEESPLAGRGLNLQF